MVIKRRHIITRIELVQFVVLKFERIYVFLQFSTRLCFHDDTFFFKYLLVRIPEHIHTWY